MKRNTDNGWFSGFDEKDPWGVGHSHRRHRTQRTRQPSLPPSQPAHNDTSSNFQWGSPQSPPQQARKWPVVLVVGLVILLAVSTFLLRSLFLLGYWIPSILPETLPAWGGQNWEEDWEADWDIDPSETYSIPVYQGDSSNLTIQLQPSKGKQALTYTQLYEACLPSTVSITVYAEETAAYGSGVILTSDGYILTCAHVTENMESATVTTSDGVVHEALMVGSDDQTDLAVLKIEAEGLQAAEFGDSGALKVGESVCAIGDSLGARFRGSLSNGIVSGLNREVSSNGYSMVLIQTTAAVNSGNSGGPLFNEYGQVVGIVNMKMTSQGDASIDNMGLAIPSATAKDIVDTLAVHGSVSRAVLGISCYSIDTTFATMSGIPEGLWVTEIQDGSDCADAGLMVGDIITAVDGAAINSVAAFQAATADLAVGDTVTLTVWRDEALSLQIEEEPDSFSQEDMDYAFAYVGELEVALVSSDQVG